MVLQNSYVYKVVGTSAVMNRISSEILILDMFSS
uniref:Uncharacterized protein n=1 Tax=Arundo donax TaxID=35708 RepID=A0A0A9AJH9_ARUDO